MDIINTIRKPGGNTFGNVTDLLKEAPIKVLIWKAYIKQCRLCFARQDVRALRHTLSSKQSCFLVLASKTLTWKKDKVCRQWEGATKPWGQTVKNQTFLHVIFVCIVGSKHCLCSSVSAYIAVFIHFGTSWKWADGGSFSRWWVATIQPLIFFILLLCSCCFVGPKKKIFSSTLCSHW